MKTTTLGAISAAFALCAVAGAQTSVQPLGIKLRVGAFLPTNESTVDATSNALFAFGAEYRLQSITLPSFGEFVGGASVSVDYFNKNDFGMIPVLFNYVGTRGPLSLSAGVGVGFASLPGANDSKFAYQLGAAYDLSVSSSVPIFVEGKFFGSEQSRLNGFGVYVGIRF
ncbi:hypothetical protein EON82_17230 [bacterium]|nr:MAG: hypothetical protein EON82_17230 [bacterium]